MTDEPTKKERLSRLQDLYANELEQIMNEIDAVEESLTNQDNV